MKHIGKSIRMIERATFASLDQELLTAYIQLLKEGRPRLSEIPDNEIFFFVRHQEPEKKYVNIWD